MGLGVGWGKLDFVLCFVVRLGLGFGCLNGGLSSRSVQAFLDGGTGEGWIRRLHDARTVLCILLMVAPSTGLVVEIHRMIFHRL